MLSKFIETRGFGMFSLSGAECGVLLLGLWLFVHERVTEQKPTRWLIIMLMSLLASCDMDVLSL